jgi:Ran GTPase-activating protein (RanGAP) involved in mRNA processing and transport
LNLTDNGITNEGLKSLAEGFNKSESLLSLNLAQNELSSGCISILSQVLSNENLNLTYLNLSSNHLTNRSAEDFANIFQ